MAHSAQAVKSALEDLGDKSTLNDFSLELAQLLIRWRYYLRNIITWAGSVYVVAIDNVRR
ncbi:MAG: hypothetical protein ACR5K4_01415 [Sodalis sp. (in: enterobacteria)]